MELNQVLAALADLPLGSIRFYDQVSSTNDEARQWALQGAADVSLVLADAQTSGRGRSGRVWYSPAGSSLAFSLVIYPQRSQVPLLPHLTAWGALAAKEALLKRYGLQVQIKWPNDMMVQSQKLGGVLVEAIWNGADIQAVILGIGLNVGHSASRLANQNATPFSIPATDVESILKKPVDRLELLRSILEEIIAWRPRIGTQAFLADWESSLAFRGEWVQVVHGNSAGMDSLADTQEAPQSIREEGVITGLERDGSLCLRTQSGKLLKISAGEIHLRLANSAAKTLQPT